MPVPGPFLCLKCLSSKTSKGGEIMQGVFIKKTVAGYQELEDLVNNNEGRVFVQRNEQFIKVLTQEQNQKYLRKWSQLAMLDLAPRADPILLLEEIKFLLKGTPGVEWFSCYIRPKSKKELQFALQEDPAEIYLEATSIFGDEYSGELVTAPFRNYHIVGPDPAQKRSWFAEISWSEAKTSWLLK